MNERIKELVAESGNGLMRDGNLYPHIGSRTEADWQRFAQLIVRECAKVADIADENKCEWIGGNILTHFGVES